MISGERLWFDAELCAHGVTDHGKRDPGADEQAVASHEAAAVADVEEGAPKFFNCAALLA